MAGTSEGGPDQGEPTPTKKRRKNKVADPKPKRLRKGRPLTPLIPRVAAAK